jgi:hypothetical protein
MLLRGHCALCAPTVFLVRTKAIHTKNTVMDKNKDGRGFFYKIANCVRSDRPERESSSADRSATPRNAGTSTETARARA